MFRRWRDGDEVDKGPFGVAEPKPSAEELCPDVLLVPLLAFDRAGYRLGYGGGYYDRTLRGLRALKPIIAIGVGFAAQEISATPRGPGDEPVDWIVTEIEAFKINTDQVEHGATVETSDRHFERIDCAANIHCIC